MTSRLKASVGAVAVLGVFVATGVVVGNAGGVGDRATSVRAAAERLSTTGLPVVGERHLLAGDSAGNGGTAEGLSS